jgi:hypothetical protein
MGMYDGGGGISCAPQNNAYARYIPIEAAGAVDKTSLPSNDQNLVKRWVQAFTKDRHRLVRALALFHIRERPVVDLDTFNRNGGHIVSNIKDMLDAVLGDVLC